MNYSEVRNIVRRSDPHVAMSFAKEIYGGSSPLAREVRTMFRKLKRYYRSASPEDIVSLVIFAGLLAGAVYMLRGNKKPEKQKTLKRTFRKQWQPKIDCEKDKWPVYAFKKIGDYVEIKPKKYAKALKQRIDDNECAAFCDRNKNEKWDTVEKAIDKFNKNNSISVIRDTDFTEDHARILGVPLGNLNKWEWPADEFDNVSY